MESKIEKETKYQLELTKEEIGMLKAATRYYSLIIKFEYDFDFEVYDMCETDDVRYIFTMDEIDTKLEKLSNIKPDYGHPRDIEFIGKLLYGSIHKAIKKLQEEEDEAVIEMLEREQKEMKDS